MAISKILCIRDCGKGYSGKHLKQALDYITAKEKTGDGKWISSLNCQVEHVYEEMRKTKEDFRKTGQRQGYHFILSFKENEVTAEIAFEIIGKFVKEYLGQNYETLYSVHDNTNHIHGHIIFNSVSFRTGKKYRYEKGDWAKFIQPITNRLCEEYGLSTIEIENKKSKEHEKEWNEYRDGKFIWSDMIKKDLNACILQSATFEGFIDLLQEKGYKVKTGKYLAIKPLGMDRFRRLKTLGEEYTEEQIRERILSENLLKYQTDKKKEQPRIVYCKVRHFKKAKLSSLQKRYFAKLYRTKQLQKRPYSQVWKYKEDIRKMKQLQEQYLFLTKYNIQTFSQLLLNMEQLKDKKREISKEKSKIFKERARYHSLFNNLKELKDLKIYETVYEPKDNFFLEEHERWNQVLNYLKKEGYTIEEVENLREHFKTEIAAVREKEKAIWKELSIANAILGKRITKEKKRESIKEKKYKKEEEQKKEQPKR